MCETSRHSNISTLSGYHTAFKLWCEIAKVELLSIVRIHSLRAHAVFITSLHYVFLMDIWSLVPWSSWLDVAFGKVVLYLQDSKAYPQVYGNFFRVAMMKTCIWRVTYRRKRSFLSEIAALPSAHFDAALLPLSQPHSVYNWHCEGAQDQEVHTLPSVQGMRWCGATVYPRNTANAKSLNA